MKIIFDEWSSYQIVLSEIETISEFGETTIWWEAKVQVILLSCEILKYALITDDVIHSTMCDVIGRVIASGENIIIRILGIYYFYSFKKNYYLSKYININVILYMN